MDQSSLRVIVSEKCCAEFDFIMGLTRGREVSGLGRVIMPPKCPENEMHVTELFISKHRSTGSSTELSGVDIAEIITSVEDPDEIKLWWHSHHDMGCFWSGTDERATRTLVSASNWFLSLVLSTKEPGILGRIDFNAGFGHRSMQPELEVRSLVSTERKEMIREILGGNYGTTEIGYDTKGVGHAIPFSEKCESKRGFRNGGSLIQQQHDNIKRDLDSGTRVVSRYDRDTFGRFSSPNK